MLNKKPAQAGRNTKGKSDGGSRNSPKVEGLDVVAGVELRRDGIFSSRLAATALYTTSPSVAYLRIDLRIHHNGKSTSICRVSE